MVLFIATMAFAALGTYYIYTDRYLNSKIQNRLLTIENTQHNIQDSIALINARNSELEIDLKAIKHLQKQNLKAAKKTNTTANNAKVRGEKQEYQIKKQEEEIKELRKIVDEQKKLFQELTARLVVTGNILSQSVVAETFEEERRNFAYYASEPWTDERDSIRNEILSYYPNYTVYDVPKKEARTSRVILKDLKQASIDSIQYYGFERFEFVDGVATKINVRLPALAELKDNILFVRAEPYLDSVVLDGCLKWERLGENKDLFQEYRVIDTSGMERKLLVTINVKVQVSEICDLDYAQAHKLSILTQSWETLQNTFASVEAPLTRNTPKKYKSEEKLNVELYRSWVPKIKEDRMRRNLWLLTYLMEQTNLPTEFLRARKGDKNSFFVEPLHFNPEKVNSYEMQGSFDCSRTNQSRIGSNHPQSLELLSAKNNHSVDVKCPWKNQIYTLSDGNDSLDDSWDDDIIFPGKGEDMLDLNWGQDLVILEKGWGKKTISKTCTQANMKNANYHLSQNSRATFHGFGLQFVVKPDFVFVGKVFPDSPAEKAGFKQGDWIVKIDNTSVDVAVDDFVRRQMLSLYKEVRTFTVKSYPTHETKIIKVDKDWIDISDFARGRQTRPEPSKQNRIVFEWPFEHNNFIVFGPGISKEDLEWEGDRVATLKGTGDKLVVKDKCFNYIFAGDMQFDEASVPDYEKPIFGPPQPENINSAIYPSE